MDVYEASQGAMNGLDTGPTIMAVTALRKKPRFVLGGTKTKARSVPSKVPMVLAIALSAIMRGATEALFEAP